MVQRKRTRGITVRALDEEIAMLKDVADDAGLSASDWIRQAIRKAHRARFGTSEPKRPKRKK